MMTPYSTNTMLDVLAGKSGAPQSTNEDVAAHQSEIHKASPDHFALRLLPGIIRRPLSSWIAARRHERDLVRLWEVSPHLLDDMGIVLTDKSTLPEHLVAAPARVIEHVAALAPDQIVDAEMAYPARRAGEPLVPAAPAEEKAKASAAAAFPLSSAI